MNMLTGKRALVTGGSRGLGRAAALAFAQEGADVAILFRKQRESADEVVAAIKALGRRAIALQADVADHDQVSAAVRESVEALGGLDIVLTAAGSGAAWQSLADTPIGYWHRVIDSNLHGSFYTVHEAMPHLIKQGSGTVIFVTSPAGDRACAMQGPYSVAKAGITNLTLTWAREVAAKGVKVNAISPGLFETDMTAPLRKGPLPDIPAGRIGQPDEFGRIAAFLASPAADYITGNVIRPDGGWFA